MENSEEKQSGASFFVFALLKGPNWLARFGGLHRRSHLLRIRLVGLLEEPVKESCQRGSRSPTLISSDASEAVRGISNRCQGKINLATSSTNMPMQHQREREIMTMLHGPWAIASHGSLRSCIECITCDLNYSMYLESFCWM